MVFQVSIPEGVGERWQHTLDLVNAKVNSLSLGAQQVKESLQQTATGASDRAINSVTTTLQQSLQSAEQIKSTTKDAVQTAITSSVDNWLVEHPAIFRFLQILGWGVNHPIISAVILLVSLALLWTTIKVVGSWIESASLSLLQLPFKLLQGLFKVTSKGFSWMWRVVKQASNKTSDIVEALPQLPSPPLQQKQQRLAEISQRLQEIHTEQNYLMQEAAELLASNAAETFHGTSLQINDPELKNVRTLNHLLP
ncbi:hypothetical protein [Iningainema tapete]|uniref:Uncharacterized protein n=1 Tax=Iningainema tapete BLCC-T55 TaxID=2748662 RepID=A0A8J6XCT0_9CYAN|nr:hypothetical protein [Iningainema tapete]MBD2772689.1 hypothetical protein [Iningainema tapete BLCC-T55]